MTKEESGQISGAIDDLAEAITFLHLAKMAALSIKGQDGNALEMVADLADTRLMGIREKLYGMLGSEAPVLRGVR